MLYRIPIANAITPKLNLFEAACAMRRLELDPARLTAILNTLDDSELARIGAELGVDRVWDAMIQPNI